MPVVGPYRKQRESTLQCFKKSTCCSIPPADLERIFDLFYTTKHESQEREGTGLARFHSLALAGVLAIGLC